MLVLKKIKWILAILLVFVLILTTNLIDRANFNKVTHSVETIYQDRLIATDILFELTDIVHRKQLALARGDSAFFGSANAILNGQYTALIKDYEGTYLTAREATLFSDLQEALGRVMELEAAYQAGGEFPHAAARHLEEANAELKKLSELQTREGRRQVGISREALEMVDLFTDIEVYVLILLAIIIQIIIIYRPSKRSKE